MRRHYQFIEILKEIYRLEFRLVLTVEWLVETHYRLKHKPNGDFVQVRVPGFKYLELEYCQESVAESWNVAKNL